MESFLQSLINSLPDPVSPDVSHDRIVIVDESNPIAFWSKFAGALVHDKCIALLDPQWPDSWKKEFVETVQQIPSDGIRRILIPTSGTTGKPKYCIHTIETLRYAAKAFAERFSKQGIVHSVNVLPQHHVGGFMPVLRSVESGGTISFAKYLDDFSQHDFGHDLKNATLSLVPTQLKRILQSESLSRGLSQFGMILIGGAACPDSLLTSARKSGLRLAPCYGSTETAALVTVLEPEQFLNGHTSVGRPLPGMQVQIDQDDVVQIQSESVQTGYYPSDSAFKRSPFRTNDLGKIDMEGNLHILGRIDRVIITGGKKVIPEQVESVSLQSGLVEDALCMGVADPNWGMRVELQVVFRLQDVHDSAHLMGILREQLPPYAVPKKIHPVDFITRDKLGKLIQ